MDPLLLSIVVAAAFGVVYKSDPTPTLPQGGRWRTLRKVDTKKDITRKSKTPDHTAANPHCQIEQKNVTRNGTLKSSAQPWKIETTA